MSLKIITLNIEGSKHLSRFPAVLQAQHPDVICLQEVFACDVPLLEKTFGMRSMFVANMNILDHNRYHIAPNGKQGIAIFTKMPCVAHVRHYVGTPHHIPTFIETDPNACNRSLLWTEVEKDGEIFTIATTHFTWTPNGETSSTQLRDLKVLFRILDEIDEVVLCGDFNAPRGKKTHQLLSERYQDNVPSEVLSTIDGSLHLAGELPFVVDGIFTSPRYRAINVQVLRGISDHCGLEAEIML